MSLFSWIKDAVERMHNSQRIMIDMVRYIEVPIREKPPNISQHDWEGLRKINDKIALNIRYDKTRADSPISGGVQSPRETVKRRAGVCMDFAALFEVIARRKGYTVRSMTSNELDHAWSEVKLNGSWWIIDTSWNVPDRDFDGKPQREEPNLLHRYFLTTVDEELMWKSKDLLTQTHDCSDATPVNYEKTVEARDLLNRLDKLINQHNTLAREQRDLVDRRNTNSRTLNNLAQKLYMAKTSAERDSLRKRIDRGKNVIAEQDTKIQKINKKLAVINPQISKLQAEVDQLKNKYPLAMTITTVRR